MSQDVDQINISDYFDFGSDLGLNTSPDGNTSGPGFTPDTSDDASENTLFNLGLSPGLVDEFLNAFRDMSWYFPFVVLPQHCSAQTLAQERPFLFLAAITCASSRHPLLQKALNKEFKDILSRNVIADGERSLDLLQGLLVYLAW